MAMHRNPFISPADVPKCEPNGGDRSMLRYRCTRHGIEIGWATYAEPRAWGIDRDWEPDDGHCFICGAEGELVGPGPVSASELLRDTAPELFDT